MAALGFLGWFLAQSTSRGNPRSSDQTVEALLVSYPLWRHRLGASLLWSISSPSIGNSKETLDLGLLDQTMVVCGTVHPHGGIIFGVGASWRGDEVLPRQCPCLRAFDSSEESVGSGKFNSGRITDKGHTKVYPGSHPLGGGSLHPASNLV
jgi:hypothetical protein